MDVRDYKKDDTDQISALYYNTVRKINSRDYSEEHVAAWAPKVYETDFWLKRFDNYDVYIVEEADKVIGFAEYQYPGHIDCFYVHHEYQRQGVGSLLCEAIEKQAKKEGTKRLFADVCLTAKAFFSAKNFSVVKEQNKSYQNLMFKQFFMEKWLD